MRRLRDGLARVEGLDTAKLATGEYILRAQANGFAEYVQPVSTTGNATVAVALSIAGLRQQVIVTASGGAQISEEVSRSITVIDQPMVE